MHTQYYSADFVYAILCFITLVDIIMLNCLSKKKNKKIEVKTKDLKGLEGRYITL